MEGKAAIHKEGTDTKKKKNTTTKQLATRKIHANNIHANISHPREDRICATKKHLHHSIKGMLEVFEDYTKSQKQA